MFDFFFHHKSPTVFFCLFVGFSFQQNVHLHFFSVSNFWEDMRCLYSPQHCRKTNNSVCIQMYPLLMNRIFDTTGLAAETRGIANKNFLALTLVLALPLPLPVVLIRMTSSRRRTLGEVKPINTLPFLDSPWWVAHYDVNKEPSSKTLLRSELWVCQCDSMDTHKDKISFFSTSDCVIHYNP